MRVSNAKFIKQYKFFQVLLLIILLGVLIWYVTAPDIVKYENRETVIGVFILYLVGEYILYLRKYYLISYSDEDGKVNLEFAGKGENISIDHQNLEKYEIKNKGLRKELVIFEKIKDGIKEHAPVSLSGLSKLDIKHILESLDKIIEHNKNNK
jgi:hypothetical protein